MKLCWSSNNDEDKRNMALEGRVKTHVKVWGATAALCDITGMKFHYLSDADLKKKKKADIKAASREKKNHFNYLIYVSTDLWCQFSVWWDLLEHGFLVTTVCVTALTRLTLCLPHINGILTSMFDTKLQPNSVALVVSLCFTHQPDPGSLCHVVLWRRGAPGDRGGQVHEDGWHERPWWRFPLPQEITGVRERAGHSVRGAWEGGSKPGWPAS